MTLHLRIQTAAAYAMLGKTEEAQTLLLQALQEAEPDEFLLPFVENYRYIKKTLEKLPQNAPSCTHPTAWKGIRTAAKAAFHAYVLHPLPR